MAGATADGRGQIISPASVMETLSTRPGQQLDCTRTAADRVELVAATQDVRALRGIVKAERTVSLKEMENAVRARATKS